MDFTNIDLKWQNMRAGIDAQVPFVRDGVRASYLQVQEKLADLAVPERVYLVGCGDSWFCGLATRLAFEAWAGITTESLQAMEFSRYLVPYAPPRSLVVATSNSGRVSRTIECVSRARARGLATVGVTSALDSPIARESAFVLDLAYSERRFAPGTSSYMASLVTSYALALSLAELSGRLARGEVEAQLERISALASAMQQTLDAIEAPIERLAQQVPFEAKIGFIGAGPNYGTAFFAMAKLIEAARHNTSGQQLEEWAHEQYFVTGPDTFTFVLAPRGAGLDRAREQLDAVRAMGSYAIAVCEADDHATQALADLALPVFGQPDEVLSPLLYCLSAEVFALHFAIAHNRTMLGFDDEHRKQINFRQIFDSQIVA
jgi:glucosamine--fructose-6-phosphate aminotransferase (isomerizing)